MNHRRGNPVLANMDVMSKKRLRYNKTQLRSNQLEHFLFIFVSIIAFALCISFVYQVNILHNDVGGVISSSNGATTISDTHDVAMNLKTSKRLRSSSSALSDQQHPPSINSSEHSHSNSNAPLHLYPKFNVLPIFSRVENESKLIQDVLEGKPTMAGIMALLQTYLAELHDKTMQLAALHAEPPAILDNFYYLASKHIVPFDQMYRKRPIFPIRDDESIFMSLAAYREHLLMDTMKYAFDNAKYPDKLFIGAVVQNCFGTVLPDGSIDTTGTPCKTGVQVIGEDKNGRPITKVSDAPVDVNGIEQFCTDPKYKKYCDAGQVRALYVHESESLGPAMARYHASKLWGGETYFLQTDSHLQFAVEWDEKYRNEIKATKAYPKSVLSSYPPGFAPGNGNSVKETNGARLCTCMTNDNDPNPIIRINTGVGYKGNEPRPTQIPFIAAGFFLAHSSFLVDVPFDPFIPWCFMGEEIALSMRAWTHGWTIYAPRKNLIAHQYRPGRLGLPKYWETVGRVFGRPGAGFNTRLQGPILKRIKHMVGYSDSTLEKIKAQNHEFVLQDLEHYGLGSERSLPEYLEFARITVDEQKHSLSCHPIEWCNQGQYE